MKQPELFETGINPALRRKPRMTTEEKRAWQVAYRQTGHARAKRSAYVRENMRRIEQRRAERSRKKFYGITTENFNRMIEGQSNRCAICKQEFRKTPYVDHDHNGGKVRGLLCSPCNVAIGLFHERPAVMRAAADYIEAHKGGE